MSNLRYRDDDGGEDDFLARFMNGLVGFNNGKGFSKATGRVPDRIASGMLMKGDSAGADQYMNGAMSRKQALMRHLDSVYGKGGYSKGILKSYLDDPDYAEGAGIKRNYVDPKTGSISKEQF